MLRFLVFLQCAVAQRRGVSAAEYAILAVGIVVVVGAAVSVVGDPLTGAFAIMGSAVLNEQANPPAAGR